MLRGAGAAAAAVASGRAMRAGAQESGESAIAEAAAAKDAAGVGGGSGVLFRDVRIFDGASPKLTPRSHVLVVGNQIVKISNAPIVPPSGAFVIDGGGRTVMPGLIDAHAHAMFAGIPLTVLLTGDPGYINVVAARDLGGMLRRGFTTIRDMQGPVFGIKQAIDSGVTPGPRIFPSGAMLSQTSGHADFRFLYEIPLDPAAPLGHAQIEGASAIADGVDEVLRATREQLMKGASQIKLAGGGGASSNYDPIDVIEYGEAEIRAAVGAAEDWNTYVAIHVYNSRSIKRAVAAGVASIEHGHLANDDAARFMAEKNVWWSLQPFTTDSPSGFPAGSENWLKQQEVRSATDTAYELAKKYRVKTAWGTDILFNPAAVADQNAYLTKMTRWYTPAEVLKMATSDNAALLALSGPRSPYKGQLGVVQMGAFADLLLVDGDPLQDLSLLGDPEANLLVVMKDGQIYKQSSTLTAAYA
ncbi:MAG: amidohydrolase family protein [Thermomicrobiales bacterium]|nr:amidohydrolase family protein [Thermomicrobiales bacterium]